MLVFFVFYPFLRIYLGSFYPFFVDDAYITLRYVNNLIQHDCFCYNINEHVLGITTLAFPYLLSILAFITKFQNLVFLTKAVNIFFECMACFAIYRIYTLVGINSLFSFLFSIALITNGSLLSGSVGGMETAFFAAACFWTVALIDRHPITAAIVSGLSFFIRPEGVILIIGQCLMYLFDKNRRRMIPFLLGLLLIYPLYIWIMFGSFVPESVAIKSMIYSKPFFALNYLFSSVNGIIPVAMIPQILKLLFVYGVAIYGMVRWDQRTYSFYLVIIFLFLFLLLYGLQNPTMWFWYTAPYVSFWSLFFFYGIFKIKGALLPRNDWILVALTVGVIILNINWVFFKKTFLYLYTERIGKYVEAVQKLQLGEGLDSKSSILTHEIGAIGYYSTAFIIDSVGLINPNLAHLGVIEKINGKYFKYGYATPSLIKATRPNFIMIQSHFITDELIKSESFKKEYVFLFEVEGSSIDDRSGNLVVYKRT